MTDALIRHSATTNKTMKTSVRKTKADREADDAIAAQAKQLVDEYGRLDAELSPLKTKIRRMEELAKIIRAWHIDADPELCVSSSGDKFKVVLGPSGMQTHIKDMSKVFRILGREQFVALASITLRALEQKLNAAAIATLICKERTGSRRIDVYKTPTAGTAA
jgi:hypothetical protein